MQKIKNWFREEPSCKTDKTFIRSAVPATFVQLVGPSPQPPEDFCSPHSTSPMNETLELYIGCPPITHVTLYPTPPATQGQSLTSRISQEIFNLIRCYTCVTPKASHWPFIPMAYLITNQLALTIMTFLHTLANLSITTSFHMEIMFLWLIPLNSPSVHAKHPALLPDLRFLFRTTLMISKCPNLCTNHPKIKLAQPKPLGTHKNVFNKAFHQTHSSAVSSGIGTDTVILLCWWMYSNHYTWPMGINSV